jgi:hypothetical protein
MRKNTLTIIDESAPITDEAWHSLMEDKTKIPKITLKQGEEFLFVQDRVVVTSHRVIDMDEDGSMG